MPTYEYLCQTCRHSFETWQKMTDAPLTSCPSCGNSIRRVLYPAGIVFKGSGFYKTDHGSGTRPTSDNEAKQTESTTEKKSTGESKTAESSSSPSNKTSNEGSSSMVGAK